MPAESVGSIIASLAARLAPPAPAGGAPARNQTAPEPAPAMSAAADAAPGRRGARIDIRV
ncbi:MAG: hypothetical protein AB7N54_12265 [Alphaproteobacteria bacterium]